MEGTRARAATAGVLLGILFLGSLAGVAPGVAGARSGGARRRQHGPAAVVHVARRTRGNALLHWHARRDLRRATIRVNGRRAHVRPLLERGQSAVYSLDAADGLRFGTDRIVVVAQPRTGRRQILRRRVHVLADAPLPAIVQPGPAIAGRPAALDGHRSRAPGDRPLRFRWRIVGAPRGAHASLRGARRRRPRLLADAPGHYRLALTLSTRGGGGAAAHASSVESAGACAVTGSAPGAFTEADRVGPVASLPLEQVPAGTLTVASGGSTSTSGAEATSTAAPGCATDVETVTVTPNTEPIGVALESRVAHEGGEAVRIGAEVFPLPKPEEGALYIALDAVTLQPLGTETSTAGPSAQVVAEGLAAEYSAKHDVLVVAAGLPGCCSSLRGASDAGFTLVENYHNDGGGTVTENQGQELGEGGEPEAPGAMDGWLERGIPLDDSAAIYSYVSPERVPFDTEAAGTPPRINTIEAAGRHYSAELPAGAGAGFEVLVTGPGLQPLYRTPSAFGTDGPKAQLEEEAMLSVLSEATGTPGDTVFIQSIGEPTPSSSIAAEIGEQIDLLGGNRWVYLSLEKGGGGYAFVGTSEAEARGLQATSAEASPQWSQAAGGADAGGAGRLQGLLRRIETSAYAPAVADSVGIPNYGLDQLVYQPGQAWPEDQTREQIAATRWIAEAVGVGSGSGSCSQPAEPDFRSVYCDDTTSMSSLSTQVAGLAYPTKEKVEFNAVEFGAVQKELIKEVGEVGDVRSLIAVMKEAIDEQDVGVEADAIAGRLLKQIPSPQTSATSGDLSLASSILFAAGDLPEVGEALGPFASVLDIASDLAQENGEASPDWKIQIAADEIGATVEERLHLELGDLGRIEDILVSDSGKLSVAAEESKRAWGIGSEGLAEASSAIRLGITQWMWTAMLPAAFELVEFKLYELERETSEPRLETEEPTEEMYCARGGQEVWYPWKHADPRSVFYPLSTFGPSISKPEGASAPRRLISFGMLSGSFSHEGSASVSPALAAKIFGKPIEGDAGLTGPRLTQRAHWRVTSPHMITEPTEAFDRGRCGVGIVP